MALSGQRPPYVPWHIGLTQEAREKVIAHAGNQDLDDFLGNHLLKLGNDFGFFDQLDDHHFRDVFGVVWDRSVDEDIGVVRGTVLAEPTLKGYDFPNPRDPRYFEDIPERMARHGDCYRLFVIGFSLYERAWTLRGTENLLMDFYEHPKFVHDFLDQIADYNIEHVKEALKYDIDAVEFGDDWGQQHGLQMGPRLWREFFKPVLKRMYASVRDAGKAVFIHSCGDVDELFDDLVEIGVNCFNPFQPEVMDIHALKASYHGRLSFFGGLSTQKTLPFGTVNDVVTETRRLLEMGANGGYIFSPAHDVEGDVPIENILAFVEAAQSQPGFQVLRLAPQNEDVLDLANKLPVQDPPHEEG